MTKALIQANPKDTYGSGFCGYLTASYPQLVEKLGFPHDCTQEGKWRSADNKVRVEWAFKGPGRTRPAVITIYDYKDRTPVADLKVWHIGIKGDRLFASQFLQEHFDVSCLDMKN